MKKIGNALEVIVFIVFVFVGCSLDSMSIPEAVLAFFALYLLFTVVVLLNNDLDGWMYERERF